MPPRPPLPQTARVAVNSHSSNENPVREMANIFYCNWSPGLTPSAAELVTVANGILTAWNNRFNAFQNITFFTDSVTVTLIDGSETQGVSSGAFGQGTLSGGDMAASLCACLSWSISAAYRGGHPRSYLPGIDRSLLDTGPSVNKLSPVQAGNIATAAGHFTSDVNGVIIGGSVTNVGTVSYVRNKVPRVTPVFFPYGSIVRVNTRLASQRRRMGKLSTGVYET